MKKLLFALAAFISFAASCQQLQNLPAYTPSNFTGIYTIGFFETSPGSGTWLPARKITFTDILNGYPKKSDSTLYSTVAGKQKRIDSSIDVFNAAIALHFLKSDTAAMLSPYLRIANAFTKAQADALYQPLGSYATTAQNALKLNISDTAAMLIPYLRIANAFTKTAADALYQPLGSYVPSSQTITINGTTYDLTANRTWTIWGGGGGVDGDADSLGGQLPAYYLNRANHTGTQLANTISNFQTTVSANTDVAASVTHAANTSNPHNVTKAQVGLGNVPNVDATSKANHTGIQAPSTIATDANNRFVTDAEKNAWNAKQDALISGTSIKTINSTSLIGSGNVFTEFQYLNAADYGVAKANTGTANTIALHALQAIAKAQHKGILFSSDSTKLTTFNWDPAVPLRGSGHNYRGTVLVSDTAAPLIQYTSNTFTNAAPIRDGCIPNFRSAFKLHLQILF